LSPNGFRLLFHNTISSVISPGLGQLGFHSSFLLTSSQEGLTDSNSLLAEG
jgi:hypothetical protein